ncbi:AAA family ATPase [Paenibacillus sp. 8b26]|uniref:AAA family ATPase n=1 Tax=Paenibacillus sp. 8b26 TaxID=3424133 RepID=UPI003D648FCD
MENISNSRIKEFSIYNLFGDRNVTIKFNENVMVLVGENGLGKTTILNIIYYTLSCEFKKLWRIKFDNIHIKFDDGNSININRKDIYPRKKVLKHYRYNEEDSVKMEIVINDYDGESYKKIIDSDYDVYEKNGDFYFDDEKIEKYDSIIRNYQEKMEPYLDGKILYFPTYRRIEEDLYKIRSVNSIREKNLIKENRNILQFGMEDVKGIFKKILEDIKSSSLNGYTQVTGKMITNLVDATSQSKITKDVKNSIQDIKTIDIILSRIDDHNLSKDDKQKIRNLIESKEIFEGELYKPLIHLLSDLIRVYNQQQRKQDQAIKTFVSVCNSYLVNKFFEYDESVLTLEVYNKKNMKEVNLSDLSSGEKQIVAIFSKLFLSVDDDFILLFDEPELSLSIEWQEKLLVDIVNSGKCKFLLAVTHSPFIFNNELKGFARSIDLFIEELNGNE